MKLTTRNINNLKTRSDWRRFLHPIMLYHSDCDADPCEAILEFDGKKILWAWDSQYRVHYKELLDMIMGKYQLLAICVGKHWYFNIICGKYRVPAFGYADLYIIVNSKGTVELGEDSYWESGGWDVGAEECCNLEKTISFTPLKKIYQELRKPLGKAWWI